MRRLFPIDPREPLFLGHWSRSSEDQEDDDNNKNKLDEPHMKRKSLILSQHPSIRSLYGSDLNTFWLSLVIVPLQLSLALVWSWPDANSGLFWMAFLVFTYVVGGSLSQLLGIMIHEGTHDLTFPSPKSELGLGWRTGISHRLFCLYLNVPLPVPIAMSFRRYHLDHHAYQGVIGKDPDLPLSFERKWVQSNQMILKCLWILLFPFLYGLRALGMSSRRCLDGWECFNILSCLSCDILFVHYIGWRAFMYLSLSMYFGYSIHPAAAHFIQEHYTWTDGQETYSYYGALNKLFLNIGYHNEHHDFTKIPWSRLPMLRKMAPEFYLTCHFHTSWWAVFWQFITRDQLGPNSRLRRSLKAHWIGRKMMAPNEATAAVTAE